MDGPPPPSPGQAQGLEVFGVPAFHPAVSSTLPLAGDGCLHMEPQRDTDWGSREQHPAMWTEVTARTFRHPKRNFLSFKVAQKQPGLLQRVCEQIQSVPSSPVRSILSSEAWAVGFPG